MKRWFVLVPVALALVGLSYAAIGIWAMGFRSVSKMDFDDDGSTSVSEILAALDVVKVPSRERPGCIEYLDAKGGAHVYTVRCPEGR